MPSWFQLVVTLVSAIALQAWIAFSVGAVVAYTESSNMYVITTYTYILIVYVSDS